jgi:hypothetical protein
MDFFRFPHTPHLAWLGAGQPRGDKLLGLSEVGELLARELIVEEKVDGANVGLSVDDTGTLRVQNRGSYLEPAHSHPQFKPLWRWLEPRAQSIAEALGPDLILFGEWCYAAHSLSYSRLPDWLLAFDIYSRTQGRFLCVRRRDELLGQLGLSVVPRLAQGRFDLAGLRGLLGNSRVGDSPAEGIYVRADEGDWLWGRAKLVRPEFAQAIQEHWSQRPVRPNQVVGTGGGSA